MFSKIKERRLRGLSDKLAMIRPTSKSELKQSCLMLSNLDVDKAEKMYDFLVKDMSEIPDIPPAQKSFVENIGEQASGVFGWLRENEDVFQKGWDFIQRIISARKGGPSVPASEPLPPINT